MLVAAPYSASANSAQQILDLQINLCYYIASILTLMYTIQYLENCLSVKVFVEKSTNLKWRQLEWWILNMVYQFTWMSKLRNFFANTNCIWYISFKCKFLIFFNVMISTLFYLTFKEYESRYFKVVLYEWINWKDWSLWLNLNVWKKRKTIIHSNIPFLYSTHHILKVHNNFPSSEFWKPTKTLVWRNIKTCEHFA